MNQRLKKQIAKKLDTLQDYLSQISEAQIINSDDPDTWDSDTLYNLAELQSNKSSFNNERQNLKEALALLEDKEIKGQKDEFNQPLYEEGLCSLIDTYQNPEVEDDYE